MKIKIFFSFIFLYVLPINSDEYHNLLNRFNQAQKAVIFDDKVGDILSNKSCNEEWDHIAQYVCRCCIVRAADKIPYDKRNGTNILESCKKEGLCTDALIQQLRKEENLENVSDTEFVNLMYDRSRVIKNVDVSFDKTLQETGIFSENSLKNFLVKAYNDHKILDSAFSDASCLSALSLVEIIGSNTGQLFLVKNTCNNREYIIKEIIKKKDEIFGLSLAAHYKPLKPYIDPYYVQNFPIIELPIAYLHYTSSNGKNWYMGIMHKADGIEFLTLMNMYIDSPTEENKNIMQKAYSSLGRTLANFHKKFMRNPNTGSLDSQSLLGNTILHGSFHQRNYFYKKNEDIVYKKNEDIMYWIDNETMGKYIIKPQSIYHDLFGSLFYIFKDRTKKFTFDFAIRDNPKKWFNTFYPAFFKAYLDTWGPDKKVHGRELITILEQYENKKLVDYCKQIIEELIK